MYAETTRFRKDPAGHNSHASGRAAVVFVALPPKISHSVQLALLVEPSAALNEPGAHAVQLVRLVAPAAAPHVPGGQYEQLPSADAFAGLAAYHPAAQVEHTDAPAGDHVMSGHAGHVTVAFVE